MRCNKELNKLPAILDKLPLTNKEDTWNTLKIEILKLKKSYIKANDEEDIKLAHTFCYHVMKYLWGIIDTKKAFNIREYSNDFSIINIEYIGLAKKIAQYFSALNVVECGYYVGVLYTLLLPNDYKSKFGIYYTPPILAERLLDNLELEGVNWSNNTILDPACGGGAFLIPVANRILRDSKIKSLSAKEKLDYLETHIRGMEIDPFAGWITQVLLDIITYQESVLSGNRLENIIEITDTIKSALRKQEKYDLIIGNPPYSKITLNTTLRKAYSRSLFGHANLYGLFIDAALRLRNTNGFIAFVTPTSFLGGEYFKNLRKLLIEEAPLVAIDFISARAGVFEDVLQETCLAVFSSTNAQGISIYDLDVYDNEYKVNRVGKLNLNLSSTPWIIPRHNSEVSLINAVKDVKTTINDYGYKASTGPLVWNRHKDQLNEVIQDGVFPIIWSEAINDGNFTFDYKVRKIKYIKLKDNQDFLVCKQPVILVQRTTSKEQSRRILTAVMPKEYIGNYNGAVVENHVNIIYPIKETKISLEGLSLILNTNIVDRIFRCISGSVAVSVSELHALPLPDYEKVKEIDSILKNMHHENIDKTDLMNKVELIVQRAYGVEV